MYNWLSYGIVSNSVRRTWESCTLAFPCAVNRVIHDSIACYAHFHNACFLVFSSFIRNSVVLAVYLLFSVACFFTVHEYYPMEHYMVNLESRLEQIQTLTDHGEYFVMNRTRQYGKTTTLHLLTEKLCKQYAVFSISFEGIEEDVYLSADRFCQNFYSLLKDEFFYQAVDGRHTRFNTQRMQKKERREIIHAGNDRLSRIHL